MFRPKLSLRRPLAVVGAAIVGLTAAVAMQSPASAHHSEIVGKFECDTKTGEFVGSWQVNAPAPRGVNKYRLSFVEAKTYVGDVATDITVPNIAVTEDERSFPHTVGQPLVGELRLPGNTTKASLAVQSAWENGYKENQPVKKSVDLSGNCVKKQPKPTATVESQCDGTVIVKLQNAEDATAAAKFEVTAGGKSTEYVVKPGKTETITVQAADAGNIKVTVKGQKDPLFDGKPAEAECATPDEAKPSFSATCTELIFEIENPETGEPVTATFTPNKGEAKTVTVAPGKTEKVTFEGVAGLVVKPAIEGYDEFAPVSWDEEKPKDCATPSPAPGGNGGGEGDEDGGALPVTGAAAGTIAGGAALLLIVGGVLFFIARRRKVTFTA